jgi:hypothetical protein
VTVIGDGAFADCKALSNATKQRILQINPNTKCLIDLTNFRRF